MTTRMATTIQKSFLVFAAVCLLGIGVLGGRFLSLGGSAAAQTSGATTTTVTSTASIDQTTEAAYKTASASVVYIVSQGVGSGSGIIYDSNGDIVTNDHVVSGATHLTVTLDNGKTYPATVVGTDAADDLAVIHISASGLTPARFATADSYQIGETVLAVGNPLDLKASVTSGLISGMNRVEQEPDGAYLYNAIQTSAPINPGNSGGALVSLDGVVIGMPTLEQTSSTDGTAAQGIGFAIPSQRIVYIANQIVTTGKVTHTDRPYLGLAPTDAASQSASPFGDFGQSTATSGALVAQVATNGPAGKAGVQQGDVIVAANGTAVTDAQDLLNVLAQEKPGNTMTLKIDRNGSTLTVQVHLGELPASG